VSLRERIVSEIREHGPIPFSRYMALCLYDRELGYYTRNAAQFGKAGDFYTSSDVHAVFGRLLARQFDEMWCALGSPATFEVLELGAGRGLFAGDVLDWSEKKFPALFRALRYHLLESSSALRHAIEERLARHLVSGKCILSETLPDTPLECGIVFANEFFDALPVEVISAQGSLRIDVHDGRFIESWAPASGSELEFLDRYGVLPEEGERVEAPLVAQDYALRASCLIDTGFFIAIDYGYTRDELLAGRHRGTVMAYRQHSASADPYEAPGEQDITAHVNFTALAAALAEGGMRTHKLLTQSQFLMGVAEKTQFSDAFEECRLPQERAKVALQLKHLVTPAGMGETFHVQVASKRLEVGRVANLSGLAFGK
jgi:SAM-dependent MidA family methyltransferase